MPVRVSKRNGKFRVVETETGRIAKNKAGTAIDGGGHKIESAAQKQSSAVNISQARKKGAKIPNRKK